MLSVELCNKEVEEAGFENCVKSSHSGTEVAFEEVLVKEVIIQKVIWRLVII